MGTSIPRPGPVSAEPTVADAATIALLPCGPGVAQNADQVRVAADTGVPYHCHDDGSGFAWTPQSAGGATDGLDIVWGPQQDGDGFLEISVQVTDGAAPVSAVRRLVVESSSAECPPGAGSSQVGFLEAQDGQVFVHTRTNAAPVIFESEAGGRNEKLVVNTEADGSFAFRITGLFDEVPGEKSLDIYVTVKLPSSTGKPFELDNVLVLSQEA